jgi:hypothetical protein
MAIERRLDPDLPPKPGASRPKRAESPRYRSLGRSPRSPPGTDCGLKARAKCNPYPTSPAPFSTPSSILKSQSTPSKGLRLQSTCFKGLICKVSFTKGLARLSLRRRVQEIQGQAYVAYFRSPSNSSFRVSAVGSLTAKDPAWRPDLFPHLPPPPFPLSLPRTLSPKVLFLKGLSPTWSPIKSGLLR